MNPFKAILLVQSIIDGNEQEADLISSEEGFQTMLLLATYESQFTTYHVNNMCTFFHYSFSLYYTV